MRLDRLLSIVILLLNRDMIRAKELAERFEVSVRTVYRDIEAINQAGIPIATSQGMNGGIRLAEGYKLDRSLLTNDELAAVVSALRSVSTAYDQPKHELLAEKFGSIVPAFQAAEFHHKAGQVLVDLSPWNRRRSLESKLERIKSAMQDGVAISFVYASAKGELSERIAEPHRLIMKGRQWYLQAYCRTREQFRLFKLLRMKDLALLDETFERREMPSEARIGQEWFEQERLTRVKLRFGGEVRHMAEEWFGIEELLPQKDGTWIAEANFPEDEWLYGFLLSFGPSLEVLSPEHLRIVIADRAGRIADIYRRSQP